MKRFILFVSVAIVFIAFALTITLLSFRDTRNQTVYLQLVLPLIFVSYWLLLIAFDEKRNNSSDEIFLSRNFSSLRGFAFIGKRHVVPFFMILFGTVVLAITGAFLGANKGTAELAWAALGLSFIYGIIVTVYFQIKLRSSVELKEQEKEMDNMGTNIAVFFASVATLGLFYLLWRLFLKRLLTQQDINQ